MSKRVINLTQLSLSLAQLSPFDSFDSFDSFKRPMWKRVLPYECSIWKRVMPSERLMWKRLMPFERIMCSRVTPGGKIIIYMPGAPLMVPYQEFCTSSTEPAHRYQFDMLTSPYSLFWNWLIRNKGSYWPEQILWFRTTLLEINYLRWLLSSTL